MACQTGDRCTNSSYKYSEDCSGSCSKDCGTCGSKCGDSCYGCGGVCSGGCTSNCGGDCTSVCSDGCGAACSYDCSSTCSGGCKGGCGSSCTGYCNIYCDNGCSGNAYTTAYNNLKDLPDIIRSDDITTISEWIISEGTRRNTSPASPTLSTDVSYPLMIGTFNAIYNNLVKMNQTNLVDEGLSGGSIRKTAIKQYLDCVRNLYTVRLKTT